MEFLLIPIFILILAVFAVSANEVGVDSREEFDDSRRSPYPTGIR